jgi:hypothetical protein
LKNQRLFIIAGYVLSGIWLTATVAAAFSMARTPAVPSSVTISSKPEAALQDLPITSPAVAPDPSSLRDPFGKAAPQAPIVQKTEGLDSSGLWAKAVILSLKKGVVIEDVQREMVYFLSEGEKANGFRVESINKEGAVVEIEGREINLPLSGGTK